MKMTLDWYLGLATPLELPGLVPLSSVCFFDFEQTSGFGFELFPFSLVGWCLIHIASGFAGEFLEHSAQRGRAFFHPAQSSPCCLPTPALLRRRRLFHR